MYGLDVSLKLQDLGEWKSTCVSRHVQQDRVMKGSGNLDGALEKLRKYKNFHAFPKTIEKQEKDHHLFIEGKIYR